MQPYSLTLTHNEILVVLQIFGVNTMNGLPTDPFAGLDEHQIAERLNGGEATLVSRGLLQYQEDDTVIVDDALLAFVGASVFPQTALLVSETRRDGTNIPVYFNATAELIVEHSSPKPGIYVFSHIPDSNLLHQRIQVVLHNLSAETLPTASHDLPLSDQALADVLLHTRQNNPAQAARLLEQAGWPAEAIQALVNDLAGATIWTGIAATGLRDAAEPASQSLMALQGGTCCWLMEQQSPGDPSMLRARTADGPTCLDSFRKLAGPLTTSSTRI